MLKNIKVITKEKKYPVFIGRGIFKKLPGLIYKRGLNKNLFVVIDSNVNKFHGKLIRQVFKNFKGKIICYNLKPGEKSKSVKELSSVYSALIKNKFGRDTLLISIGGGVTGDLAGFIAATYMRGIQIVHVPTTIISTVDSSIGGKTGINFNGIKNIIGSFYQPEFILTDIDFLSTLPKDETCSGVGEIIKYALLSDNNLYNYVYHNLNKIYSLDPVVLQRIITISLSFKSAVVKSDEKEKGLRKILNLGHTFAHAFESEMKFKIKHGEAVIAGITASLFLSNKSGFLTESRLDELLKLPLKANIPSRFNLENHHSILNYMYGDKKNREDRIKFVLLSDIGKIITDVSLPEKDIIYSLKKMNKVLSSGSV